MSKQFEELSQPVGYFIEWQDAETGEKEWCECSKQNGVPLYSKAYVTALLAALEEKDRRIAELEQRLQQPIKLPDRKTANDYVDSDFSNEELAMIYNTCRLECSVKIKNAGFKVEGE